MACFARLWGLKIIEFQMSFKSKINEDEAVDTKAHNLTSRVSRAASVAASFASAIDREGRFPQEAISALKSERLLSVMVPRANGGEGAALADVMNVCYTLGQACASTALIFAMHQVSVYCLMRHGKDSGWHNEFLRNVARNQLLLASSTTEGQGGGNVRSSIGAVIREGTRISLNRAATVVSYGAYADAIVTVARRAPDSAPTDQVLIAFSKEDYSLDSTVSWDTLGMRGTCSAGYNLVAYGLESQILPVTYSAIHSESMVPSAHLLWSSVWAGIAAGAVERARVFTRKAARAAAGQLPPGAAYYAKASSQLRQLRALITSNLDQFERVADDRDALQQPRFQTSLAMLKVEASELAVATVMSTMRSTGLSGYRNDSDVSIGRFLRDILSSPIMINNDRILANLASSIMLSETPSTLTE